MTYEPYLSDDDMESCVNSIATGYHAIESLNLQNGDTLVLGQLGDPRFSQELIDSLPKKLEIIDLDFSKYANEEDVCYPVDNLVLEKDWPALKLSPLGEGRSVISMPFGDYLKHVDELLDSKPAGSIKCFLDMSEYRAVDRDSRRSDGENYMQYNMIEYYGEGEADWNAYSINWDSLDDLVYDYLYDNDPALLLHADEWDALLYVLLSAHLCGNGIAATIIPDKHLTSPSYGIARRTLLHQGLIQQIVYLSKTSEHQDHLDLVVTSRIPTNKIRFSADKTGKWMENRLEGSPFYSMPDLADLSDNLLPYISSQLVDEYARHDGNGTFINTSEANSVSNRDVLNNNALLGYDSARVYLLTRDDGRPLGEIVERITPIAPPSSSSRSFYSLEGSCWESFIPKTNHKKILAVGTASFDGSGAFRERGNLCKGEGPGVYGTRLNSLPSEETILKPFDLLISRINRTPTNKHSLSDRPMAEPKLALVPEMAAERNILVCGAGSICLRSISDDYVHSLALFCYFSRGAGNKILAALATQSSSLTWKQLSSIKVTPELDPHSPEWGEYREKFCKQAQRVIDLQRKRDELLERLDAEERAAVELASQL